MYIKDNIRCEIHVLEKKVKRMKFYRQILIEKFSRSVVTDLCKLLATSTVLEKKIDFNVLKVNLFV